MLPLAKLVRPVCGGFFLGRGEDGADCDLG